MTDNQEQEKMASGYDGHAAKRQRTDVEGHGVQSGNRVRIIRIRNIIVQQSILFSEQ